MQYPYEIIDNKIPFLLRNKVWNYIRKMEYYVVSKQIQNNFKSIKYIPENNKKEYLQFSNNQFMHRTVFGNDELDLHNHPIILELWNKINEILENKFVIDGEPEGIAGSNNKWRIYVNGQPNENIKRSHTVHRDTSKINEENYFTLLYIANPVWYPTWFGEIIFYESDESSEDKQQFQNGYGQSRNFGVGTPYAIISPKPGRIILYDSRTLHTTRPTAVWSEEMRFAVAFRLRKT